MSTARDADAKKPGGGASKSPSSSGTMKARPAARPAAKPSGPKTVLPRTGGKGVSGPYKVDMGKRVGAGAIDALLAGLIGFAVAFAAGPFGALAPLLYMLVRDGMPIPPLDNQSIGKKILGLHVEVTATGESHADIVSSVKRNLSLGAGLLLFLPLWYVIGAGAFAVIPIPAVVELVLAAKDPNGLRFGDRLAGTKVLD